MRRWAWLPCVLTAGLACAEAVLRGSSLRVLGAAILTAIAVVGAVVASRRPENASGWLLSTVALSFATCIAGGAVYEVRGLEAGAWVASWMWVPGMVAAAAFPLLFPTGRPPGPRWRPVLWVLCVAAPLLLFGAAFEPGELEDYPGVVNPFGVAVASAVGAVGFALLLVAIVGSTASLVVRFRRSRGVERQQLKWVTTAAIGFPLALSAPVGDDAGFLLLVGAIFVLALAVAVAILRYRLYDIDLIINRALVYTGLTVTLVAAYLVTVLLSQLVLPSRGDLGVAVSTLAAAAVFAPARRRIQAGVDRRFFRRRYDAELTLQAFGARLRDEVDLGMLSDDLRGVVAETVQPAHISLWLR